ncbi:oligosaccharide flippase family protein [Pontibacter sp. 172403-2]|uniref:lipopolysaccharide biosynthesis protein n=1 Tax=Pontibacter rufus TaxID=2791028 RepID=UPI0018AF9B2C|nr:oligosaccharide flippase family protein [Pontibacter sp. 172403-2]MBF9253260.1 oligosaccharide flippase family protein [Pontibacter sp. 172403-2]
MLYLINTKVNEFLLQKNERSAKILRNIIWSFGLKGGSILVGLILVPMTINYINPIQYGIWITISSIVSWMSFFDIGMGNGLRNQVAAAIALKKYDEAQKYVSSTYVVLGFISFVLLVIFCFINPYINWRGFLNIPGSVKDNISLAIFIVFCSFCIQFVVQLINIVLTSIHNPAKSNLITFLGQLGALATVFVLTKTIPGSLTVLVLTLTLVPIITLIIASAIFYNTKLKFIAPKFSLFDFSYAKNIFSVGTSFFIIQIGSIILLQTDNIIISKFIGPSSVTEFNVSFKLFSVIMMLFSIIMTPYWSAFTDANAKKDYSWMKANMKRIRRIWLLISVLVVPTLLVCSDLIFKFWIGNSIQISKSLSMWLALYVIGYICLNLNSYFLNGVGKIKIQLYLYIIVCFLNIPLSCILAKEVGINGVVISNIIMLLIMNIILWIQSNKILSQNDGGLWAK